MRPRSAGLILLVLAPLAVPVSAALASPPSNPRPPHVPDQPAWKIDVPSQPSYGLEGVGRGCQHRPVVPVGDRTAPRQGSCPSPFDDSARTALAAVLAGIVRQLRSDATGRVPELDRDARVGRESDGT